MSWKETLNKDVNVYEFKVNLPGCGETLTLRPLSTKELKKLLIYENNEDPEVLENAFDEILNHIILSDIDINDMYIYDRYVLLFEMRKNSKGSIIDLPMHICSSCKSQSVNKINLNDIVIKQLPKKLNNTINLTESISVNVDFIKRSDMKELFSYINSRSYEEEKTKMTDIAIYTYASIIKEIVTADETIKATIDDKIYLIENLPENIFEKITKWFDENSFGLTEIKHEKVCKNCGHKDEMNFDLSSIL